MKRIILTVALVAVFAGVDGLTAQEYQLVVNAANPTTEIASDDASKIFQKKASKFDHGEPPWTFYASDVDHGFGQSESDAADDELRA